jgi:hypothetical protein
MMLRKSGLHFLILSIAAVVFFTTGARRAFVISYDFVPVYTGARCLMHGCNPYQTAQLQQQFFAGGGRAEELPSWDIDVPVYPPSTFLVLSPLALLSYPMARLLWFVMNGCLFVTATTLIVSMCTELSPSQRWMATLLASFILLTSGILLVLGQPALFAISLLVIGVYLFLHDRWLGLAAFLWMLSLAVKPQIGGLIVLYFLARKIEWRYVAVAMAGAAAILISAMLILQHHPGSSQWLATLQSNLASTLGPGGSADPRPANYQAVGDINLQAITSIFVTDAHRFNLLAYAIFLLLLAALFVVVLRMASGQEIHLLALAALSLLSLTPIYHRHYDTRLLVLTIPAIVIVSAHRRLLGVCIGLLTMLAIISLQYRVQLALISHDRWNHVLQNKLLFISLLRQQNLELLILFVLYLIAMRSISLSRLSPPESLLAFKPLLSAHR